MGLYLARPIVQAHGGSIAYRRDGGESVYKPRLPPRARTAAPRDRTPGGAVPAHALRPCELEVRDDGRYSYNLGGQPASRWIYERDDPPGQARALNQAFPALLLDFNPDEDRRS